MRPKLPLFISLMLVNATFVTHGTMADFSGFIDIDDPSPESQSSQSRKLVDSSDGEGVEEDDYGSGTYESGSTSENTSSDEAATIDTNAGVNQEDSNKSTFFSTEVIVAVVVGAVCLVILIAFTVYRLLN